MAKIERTVLDDLTDEEDVARLAEAEADIAAGRLVPHEEVANWLSDWGTTQSVKPPARWFK